MDIGNVKDIFQSKWVSRDKQDYQTTIVFKIQKIT